MPEKLVFRNELFDDHYSKLLYNSFCAGKPIRHLVIDNLLQKELADSIYKNFPSLKEMNTHYKGINEKKAEHSNFSELHPSFHQLHESLSAPEFISWLQKITGIDKLNTIEDRLSYGLHQGGHNSFLDIHIDYNLHPIEKLYRKLNFILFFNPEWDKNWGGHLELWDKDVKNCIQSIAPIFNRCVIFECSEVSYHGYNRISAPEHITRKSYYQYYFITPPSNISFHDTIFKLTPRESKMKKTITYTKDMIKNSAKKFFVKIGWKKFLK